VGVRQTLLEGRNLRRKERDLGEAGRLIFRPYEIVSGSTVSRRQLQIERLKKKAPFYVENNLAGKGEGG